MQIASLLEHLFGHKKRKTGEPYNSHPYAVKAILEQNGVHTKDILDAALLHDVIEDSHINQQYLALRFGPRIAKIVQILSKQPVWSTSYCKMKSNLDQMELTWVSYPEALLIKMADRLHNLQTIEGFKPAKQREYIQETNQMLMPLFANVIRQNKLHSLDKPLKSIYKALENEVKYIESTFI